MEKIDEMMQCRDLMEKHDYPAAMILGISRDIDEIVNEGMQNRK